MVEQPLDVIQLSLNHVCKIGLKVWGSSRWICLKLVSFDWSLLKGEPQSFLANFACQTFLEFLGTMNSGKENLRLLVL
jgi:hypothetical protein